MLEMQGLFFFSFLNYTLIVVSVDDSSEASEVIEKWNIRQNMSQALSNNINEIYVYNYSVADMYVRVRLIISEQVGVLIYD